MFILMTQRFYLSTKGQADLLFTQGLISDSEKPLGWLIIELKIHMEYSLDKTI